MPQIPFDSLPDDARLWVFASERRLDAIETGAVLDAVDRFLGQWAAHGTPVVAGRDWRDDQFLLIGVDERTSGLSGCSIDALVRSLRALQGRIGAAIVDAPPVWFRATDRVETVSRDAFEELVARGAVGPETIVFDNTLAMVGALRAGRFELPAREAWHGAAFFQESGT